MGRDVVDHVIVGPRAVSDLANGVASEVGYLESVEPIGSSEESDVSLVMTVDGTGVAGGACSGLTDAGMEVAGAGVDVEECGSGVGGAAADGYSGVMVSPFSTYTNGTWS